MRKILILQMRPEDKAANSEFEAILRVGNIDKEKVHRIRLEQPNIPEVNLNDYYAIIAGGSPFDVSCLPEYKSNAQLQVEKFFNSLFNKVTEHDFPFLGACSGNGLLGNYCGTSISTKYAEPVGSVDVFLTKEGQKDDLLKGLPEQFTALVGHKEACDVVPSDAVLLMSSKTCPVQMFRIKKNIYATQFHPEADGEEFILRVDIYKDHGYFKPEEAAQLKSKLTGIKAPETNIILKRFVEKYTI
ncbi:MAG: glutamine amidotransferase [Flavobacteriaceae bacterium]|nr:glutamine amidotransferase [Bacteroidia bacterium]NNK81839.1 glutamine amidotransferase [Flavobacteriaceae bacterium]